MEDVTFVRANAVPKRRAATYLDTPVTKRQQHTHNNSSASDTAKVDSATSAVHMSTEPGIVQFSLVSGRQAKQENRTISPECRRLAETVMTNIVEDRVQQLVDQLAIRERSSNEQSNSSHVTVGKPRLRHVNEASKTYIDSLGTDNKQLRREVSRLKDQTYQERSARSDASFREANGSKAETERRLRTSEERLWEKNVELLKEIDNVNKELRKRDQQITTSKSRSVELEEEGTRMREKMNRQRKDLAKLNNTNLRLQKELEAFKESVSDHRSTRTVFDESALQAAEDKAHELSETNETLQKKMAEQKETITKLRKQDSRSRVRTEKKETEGALKSAKTKTDAMFAHYGAVQNKNSVLIGKLTMMAQAGGFGNPGSTYRKELDRS